MKPSFKLVALLICTLPLFAHASDGAEALQRFNERNRAMFAQQANAIEARKQKELQRAEREKESVPASAVQKDQKPAN